MRRIRGILEAHLLLFAVIAFLVAAIEGYKFIHYIWTH